MHITSLPGTRSALRSNVSFTPYALQESDPAIRYTGAWNAYSTPAAYGGVVNYAIGAGVGYETTTPTGCQQLVFEGYSDPGNAAFDALVNGVKVGSGTQSTAAVGGGVQQRVYFTFTGLEGGDIVRLVATDNGALVADQISFS